MRSGSYNVFGRRDLLHTRLGKITVLALVLLLSVGCTQQILGVNFSGIWDGTATFTQEDEWAGITYTLAMVLQQKGTSLTGEVGLGTPLISFRIPIESGSATGRSLSLTARGVVSIAGSSVSVSITLKGEYGDQLLRGIGTYTVRGVTHTFTWTAQRR
jgi:hypothetical protein